MQTHSLLVPAIVALLSTSAEAQLRSIASMAELQCRLHQMRSSDPSPPRLRSTPAPVKPAAQMKQPGPATRPLFGPFHRLRSLSQSDQVADLQVRSGELWGRGYRGTSPTAQAYNGPLPEGASGIEFYTSVKPSGFQEGESARRPVQWPFPAPGVRLHEDFGVIPIKITRNTQTGRLPPPATGTSSLPPLR